MLFRSFPDPELLGVDRIIPDLSYLQQRGSAAALVLTHGHEDHIGGVPYVLPHLDGAVYGTALTLAFVANKLEEHDVEPKTVEVKPGSTITIGPFTLEFVRVTHSMPDCVAVVVRTPQGVLLHTGDFKVDQTPLDGQAFDLHRFAQLGSEGVLAMFCDSTNIDRRGYTGSEADVEDAFEEVFTSTEGKIIVATFSSSLYRLQIVVDLAAQFDRKVAFVGRGMNENSQIAQRLGFLHLPTGVVIKDSDVGFFEARDVVCLATGSQGEPNAALSRIAIDGHRHVQVKEGDRVVISARAIPGNEKAIGRVMNHLSRRGADIVTPATADSAHAPTTKAAATTAEIATRRPCPPAPYSTRRVATEANKPEARYTVVAPRAGPSRHDHEGVVTIVPAWRRRISSIRTNRCTTEAVDACWMPRISWAVGMKRPVPPTG